MPLNHEINPAGFRIGVVGAGAWGTALADLLAVEGFKIDQWVYEAEVVEQIKATRENKYFLPGFTLSDNIFPSNDLTRVVTNKQIVLIVVPSHVMRETTLKMAGHLSEGTIVLSASKGIENKTLLTMSGVIKETLSATNGLKLAVISGPSFAKEVAQRFPTVVTVASEDPKTSELIQRVFATRYFRVYTSNDMLGVELGGATKNVIAIAAGVVDGLGLGLNTRAALITRGMTEVRRLGVKLGANPRTFTGLAGFGDLVLTCTGNLSRNHTLGMQIGEGKKLTYILAEMRTVAEGVKTAKSVYFLSRKLEVEMPICHEMYRILYEDLSPQEAVHRLMTRDLRQELDEE